MRVRLPPSIISQIESHLRPDFIPIINLSTITQSPYRRSTTGLPIQSGYSYGMKPKREIKPHYDSDPLAPSHLFRTTLRSHIEAAHSHLDSEPFDFSQINTIIRRQVTYSKLITSFLDHPKGLKGIETLLNRSLNEKIPISIPTLTTILKSVLSLKDINERLEVINKILPLLPEKLDIPLLDVLLRNIIKDINPTIDVVEKIINDCLNLDKPINGREDWPLEIWDLLFTSYHQNLDFKSSLEALKEFKDIIQDKLNSDKLPSTSSIRPKYLHEILNYEEKRSICKVYSTVLNTWRRSNNINKKGSLFPRNLAEDLINMIGQSTKPSLNFLNIWMKCERISGDQEASFKIWELIESKKFEDNLPNTESWICLFQLYSSSIQSNKLIKNLPSFENSLKRLFRQCNDYPKLNLLNITLINTILDYTLLTDLATSLIISQQMKDNWIIPDRKLIDKLSSSIMLNILKLPLKEQFQLGINHSTKRRGVSIKSSQTRKRMGLNVDQWDLITETLHNIRLKNQNQEMEIEKEELEMIWLPFSMPIARIKKSNFQDSSINNDDQIIIKSSINVKEQSDDNNLANSPKKETLPEKILPSLIILLKRLIIHLERRKSKSKSKSTSISSDSNFNVDMPKKEDEQILYDIVNKVRTQLIPTEKIHKRHLIL